MANLYHVLFIINLTVFSNLLVARFSENTGKIPGFFSASDMLAYTTEVTMCNAYSLVELLLVFTLIAMALLFGEPTFRHLFSTKDADLVTQTIINLLNYARSEAIKRGHNISICPSDDGKQCGSDWAKGQIIIDTESNEVLQHFAQLPRGNRLTWNNSFGNNNEIIFTAMGYANGQKGSLVYQSDYGAKITVTIEKSGRWRVINDTS